MYGITKLYLVVVRGGTTLVQFNLLRVYVPYKVYVFELHNTVILFPLILGHVGRSSLSRQSVNT